MYGRIRKGRPWVQWTQKTRANTGVWRWNTLLHIYPAMKQLVEVEGMSIREAARFIEQDSTGQVIEARADHVYRNRAAPRGAPEPNSGNDKESDELEKMHGGGYVWQNKAR